MSDEDTSPQVAAAMSLHVAGASAVAGGGSPTPRRAANSPTRDNATAHSLGHTAGQIEAAMLPAATKATLHELYAENSQLRARMKQLTLELREEREITHRRMRTVAASMDSGGSFRSRSAHHIGMMPIAEAATQTPPIKGLKTVNQAARIAAASLLTAQSGCQTEILMRDLATHLSSQSSHGQEETRKLKAEVLRSHAECASLQHAIQVLRQSVAVNPTVDEKNALAQAQLAHTQAMDRISQLSEALRSANSRIGDLEQQINHMMMSAAEMERHAAVDGTAGGRSSSWARDRLMSGPLMLQKGTMTDAALVQVGMPSATGAVTSAAQQQQQNVPTAVSRSEQSSALEAALSMTRAQLRSALDELAALREQQSALPPLAGGRRGARGASSSRTDDDGRTRSIGVTVDLYDDIHRLFRHNNLEFTVRSVEELFAVRELHYAATKMTPSYVAERSEKHLRDQVALSDSIAVSELRKDLESAREELIQSHRTIDELTYALDLEKRERANPFAALQRYMSGQETTSGPQPLTGDLGARAQSTMAADKQLQKEIAFVCDTLAATKAQAEQLQEELRAALLERDAALASFRQLKQRSEAVLRGCSEIAESSKSESDAAITQLTQSLRSRERELFDIKGQFAAVQRQLMSTTKQRDEITKEAEVCRQRVAAVQSAMSKLREESNAQAVQLRELRVQMAAAQAQALATTPRSVGTPRGLGVASRGLAPNSPMSQSRAGRSSSAPRSRSADLLAGDGVAEQALQVALSERARLREQITRLTAFSDDVAGGVAANAVGPGHGYGVPTAVAAAASAGERAASPQEIRSPSPDDRRHISSASRQRSAAHRQAPATPHHHHHQPPSVVSPSPADDMPAEQLRAEYEEFRGCFLRLAQIVPSSTTAREVTQSIATVIDEQRERINGLEGEVKKRSIAFQTAKKALAEAKDRVSELERKVELTQALEIRLQQQEKHLDKQKRQLMKQKEDADQSREDLLNANRTLETELETTRKHLAEVRQELLEGRDVLMTLMMQEGGLGEEGAATTRNSSTSVADKQQLRPREPSSSVATSAAADSAAATGMLSVNNPQRSGSKASDKSSTASKPSAGKR